MQISPKVNAKANVRSKKIQQPTEQIVSGQSVQDARRPDQVAHGGRESGGIDPDGDKRVPDVDVSEEAVISLEEDTGGVERGQDGSLQSRKTILLACEGSPI